MGVRRGPRRRPASACSCWPCRRRVEVDAAAAQLGERRPRPARRPTGPVAVRRARRGARPVRRRARPSRRLGSRPRGARGTLPRVESSQRTRRQRATSRSLRRPRRRSVAGLPGPLAAGRARPTGSTSSGAPDHAEDPARERPPQRRRRDRRAPPTSRPSPRGGPGVAAEAEIPFMPAARPAPGLHRRAGGRRPRRDARRDGRPRRRSRARQSAGARGPRHRPLGPGRPVRDAGRVRLQRRPRVRAQRRALPAPALGPDGVPRPARRAARDGHRPPGQPRVPGDGRRRSRDDGRRRGSPSPTRSSAPTRTRRWSTASACSAGASAASRPRRSLLGQPLYSRCPGSSASACPASCRRAPRPPTSSSWSPRCCARSASSARSSSSPATGWPACRLADRATIANMSPEFGATSTLFPIDDETLAYLRLTGRSAERVALVEALRQGPGPVARARPRARLRRPADARPGDGRAVRRRPAAAPGPGAADAPARELPVELPGRPAAPATARSGGASVPTAGPSRSRPPSPSPPATRRRSRAPRRRWTRRPRPRRWSSRGAIATAYPSVALEVRRRAGDDPDRLGGHRRDHLLHQHLQPDGDGRRRPARPERRGRGLRVSPTVKTSLAPGSKAVTGYLETAGLMAPLEQLGFALAGYGCTTCIGNSGPLDEPIAEAIEEHELVDRGGPVGQPQLRGPHPSPRARELPRLAAARRRVRAGRPGRHRPDHGAARASTTTASPSSSPTSGRRPTRSGRSSRDSIDPELFRRTYASVFEGDDRWRALPIPDGDRYAWDPTSTYIARPPFFEGLTLEPAPVDRHRRRAGAGASSATR